MMKKFALILTSAALMLGLAACGGSGEDAEATETYTGIVEEVKDFALIVTSEDGEDAYLFNLEDVECDAEVGDKVTVTYTGDMSDMDSQLNATKVELSE